LAKSIERSCAVAGEIRVLGMRRAFTVVAAVLALAFAAQPAGAKDDPKLRTMAEIGAALEAHGITPYGVYKSKSSKAYKKQLKYPLIFAYKRALILEPSEDVLQEPFLAAMADLGARRGSER
jgi:hypothetical protein